MTYVDCCDIDEISQIEINIMLVECGIKGGYYKLHCMLPGIIIVKRLFDLKTDEELMLICTFLNPRTRPTSSRYVEIYVTRKPTLVIEDDMTVYEKEIFMQNPFLDST